MSKYNQPLSGNEMPRFAGIASMSRLPTPETRKGIEVGIIGVPLDIGTSNRTGTRYGPRQIRSESVLVRPYNMATGAAPFDSFQVADLGDVALNPYNLKASIDIIEQHYKELLRDPITPMSLGGDHTIALPILRAVAEKHGPVALVHVDAHADVNDTMFGEEITHGTIFRRAIEEGASKKEAPGIVSQTLADLPGFHNTLMSVVAETFGQVLICSFSGVRDQPLLWAHYADSHCGLGFGLIVTLSV